MSIEERQREEKEQRRRTIVDAAEAVLRDTSVENLTMSTVADEARLSRSLLYVYFDDLDDIVLAVTLRGFEMLVDRFEEVVAAHDRGIEKIRAVGDAYVRFAHEHPLHFDLVARFETRSSDADDTTEREGKCLRAGNRVMEIMTEAIQSGIDDGSIRSELDPGLTSITLWGYTHGLIQVIAKKSAALKTQYQIDETSLVDFGLDLAGFALSGASPDDADDGPTPSNGASPNR